MNKLFPAYGSRKDIYVAQFVPATLTFIVILIIDSVIQNRPGDLVTLQILSKAVFAISAGWLVVLSYLGANKFTTFLFLANSILAVDYALFLYTSSAHLYTFGVIFGSIAILIALPILICVVWKIIKDLSS